MADLQPQRGDDKVAIPFTFDSKWNTLELKISKVYILFGSIILAVILWIIVMIIAGSNNIRLWASVILLVVAPTIVRYAVVEEGKFKKNYRMLRENNYTYNYSLFWSIYDSSTSSPTVFYHLSGMYSVFVAFDKDVVVGKGVDSDFEHYDALSDAYNALAKRGINCTHIDYMDNVGKDVRLAAMMDKLEAECHAEDLKNCVLDMYTYMQYQMSDTYSDYDVYCFTSKMQPDLFLDELYPVLNAFLQANYIRYRILDRQDLRDLVASVMGLPDFSVTRSCDSLFAHKGLTSYLKIIWVEKDGVREKVNKTKAEIKAEARILEEEKEARKQSRKRHNRTTGDIAINLFDGEVEDQPQEPKTPSAFRSKTANTGTRPNLAKTPAQPKAQAQQTAPAQQDSNYSATPAVQSPFNMTKGTARPNQNVGASRAVNNQPAQLGSQQQQNSDDVNLYDSDDEFNLFGDE